VLGPFRLVVLLAAMALSLNACGDGGGSGDDRPGQARDVGRDAGLPDEVQRFLALAATGLQSTFQVTYESTSPGGAGRVVVTQRPPDRRVDIEGATGAVDTTMVVDGATYQCSRSTGGEWRCLEVRGPAPPSVVSFDADALARTTDALTAARDDYDFVIEERDIADVSASCLITTLKAGRQASASQSPAGTLCLSPEGASLWVERPGERLAASRYTTAVDDGLFVLPAAVP
jgi:hypothetical protein